MHIRTYKPSDISTLFTINQAGVPGVGEETAASLQRFIEMSTCFVAVDASDTPLGFITLIPPMTAQYPSANLRWLEAWGDDFIYVDRIAIGEGARDLGVGAALYAKAIEAFAPRWSWIVCEVNLRPANPGSQRFHGRLGFEEIGRRSYAEDTKEVVYLARRLRDA